MYEYSLTDRSIVQFDKSLPPNWRMRRHWCDVIVACCMPCKSTRTATSDRTERVQITGKWAWFIKALMTSGTRCSDFSFFLSFFLSIFFPIFLIYFLQVVLVQTIVISFVPFDTFTNSSSGWVAVVVSIQNSFPCLGHLRCTPIDLFSFLFVWFLHPAAPRVLRFEYSTYVFMKACHFDFSG